MSRDRLFAACEQLRDALDEFIAAHAEHAGGHAPFLWATFDGRDAIANIHPSWIPKIMELITDGNPRAPVTTVDFDDEEISISERKSVTNQ